MSAGIAINGRFLTQRTTGVQRYAREIVHALDAIDMPDVTLELICPPGAERMAGLRTIRQSFVGAGSGQAWEQLQLPWFAAGRPLLCLCNLAPILCRNRAVVIHDAAIFDAPGGYSRTFRAWYHFAQRALVASGAQVITVSQFSRERLEAALHVQRDKLEVVGGSGDHVTRLEPDLSVVGRLGLNDRPFVLAVGSLHPNKNIGTLETAMRDARLAGLQLIVVGGRRSSVFAKTEGGTAPNVHYTGYVTDEQLVGLLRCATLFVFPSRYEGFGLPLLEAMRLGCPVLASRAAAIPEVCGQDAAAYFDPSDAVQLASAMAALVADGAARARLVAAGHRRAEQMTWSAQAQMLLNLVRKRLPAVVAHRPNPT